MIVRLQLLFNIFIFISIITFILFIIGLLFTRKFNNKYRNIYALFIDVNKGLSTLYASILLSFLLSIFFLIFIDKYDTFGIYMIIVAGIISSIISFNLKFIINNTIHTFITAALLWLLRVVNNYLEFVMFDTKVLVLKYLFMFVIFIYITFVSIRKVEICIKLSNKTGR